MVSFYVCSPKNNIQGKVDGFEGAVTAVSTLKVLQGSQTKNMFTGMAGNNKIKNVSKGGH